MVRINRFVSLLLVVWAGSVMAQSPHILNTFDGSSEGWEQGFGIINNINYDENGRLTWETDGSGGAIRDNYNNIPALFQPNAGGVDLTGLSEIEFVNVMYTGDDPTINVEFFLQCGVGYTYKGSAQLIGHDVQFTAGIPQTITVPLSVLLPAEIAWVTTWGINIRAHTAVALWSMEEVRSIGPALTERYIAQFTPDSPDNGFQSVFVNFNGGAIQGNGDIQSQAGLSINAGAGVDGALEFVSLGGATNGQGNGIGGALSIGNGAGNLSSTSNDYYSRPTDISNYQFIDWYCRANGPEGESIGAHIFIQSGGYNYQVLGGQPVNLPADGNWHKLTGEFTGLNFLDNVERIGINFFGHPTDLTIQIDHIRAHNDQPTRIQNWSLY